MNKEKTTEQKKSKKQEEQATLKNVSVVSAAAEVIQRYGLAAKEHVVSYTGKDNETGKVLSKSLKNISEQNVHPDFVKQNIKQQAGFTAEVKEAARYNADRIINSDDFALFGSRRIIYVDDKNNIIDVSHGTRLERGNVRKVRTEDIGMGNDPLYDHVIVDEKGNIVKDSGSQMKFVGKTPEEALKKLVSRKFQKYLDADVTIDVPSDFYGGISELALKKITELLNEIEELEKLGKKDIARLKTSELKRYLDVYEKLQYSNVSNADAIEARLNPKLSVAKDIIRISHRAGVEQAKWGAAISGIMSFGNNLVAVIKEEKSAKRAAIDVVRDTGTGTVLSYTTAFTGTTIKALMQNATDNTIRAASKTNFPGLLVITTVETGKTLSKYFRGKIDGVQCLTELGEKGSGLLASSMFSALGVAGAVSVVGKSVFIGQIAIPIPIIGGLIGGMVGYALNSACYEILIKSLNEAKLAREERIKIEGECKEAILNIRQYRIELEQIFSKYFTEHLSTFRSAFAGIKKSLEEDNIDGFIDSMTIIPQYLGKKVQFRNMTDFIGIMNNPEPLKF